MAKKGSEEVVKVVCPECGVLLRREQIPAHLDMHWGPTCPERTKFPQGHERYMMLWEAYKEVV